MIHSIKEAKITGSKNEIIILTNIITRKPIRQFKEELMDSLSKDPNIFIAISCELFYY